MGYIVCTLCVFVRAGLISAFPMFGSSFFYIQSSSSTTFYAPCIVAVNQHGLHFLHKNTHVRVESHSSFSPVFFFFIFTHIYIIYNTWSL